MGREWESPIQARIKGSLCNFQLDFEIALPPLGIPMIKLPQFPPRLPTINLFCPCDEEIEQALE